MSEPVDELAALRARRAAERTPPAPRPRIFVDADGDVCIDPGVGDIMTAWSKPDAVDLGLAIIALADEKFMDEIALALSDARRRARRRNRRKPTAR